ncbi:MAG: hypothetical protein H7317_16505 [Pseudorhodobacter sp.]|nr:hypothetical protein [Pseudorhodobacter sp.]
MSSGLKVAVPGFAHGRRQSGADQRQRQTAQHLIGPDDHGRHRKQHPEHQTTVKSTPRHRTGTGTATTVAIAVTAPSAINTCPPD